MRPGDRVIYFKSYSFAPAPGRIGYVTRLLPASGWMMLAPEPGGRPIIHVQRRHVHPYSDELWAACRQWQRNAELLNEQHRRLMAGKAPEELLALGEW